MRATPQRGFTLLEMIVSVGLFAIVMMVATGAYFTLIALDRQARATNEVVNNLSFAVDTMTRGIRTGTNYKCINGTHDSYGNATNGDCTQFSYTDTGLGMTVTYYLEAGGTIGRCEGNGVCNDTTASKLTDPAITLSTSASSYGLVFYVRGVGSSSPPLNNQQPQVLFTIKGTMPGDSKGTLVPFVIEEDATQRYTDI